jgi:PAS domain-containing protein
MGRTNAQMGIEATRIDVTAERAERLASLVTLSYEPMFAWRLDGPIEFWNAGAERLYGFASDEAIGRSSHSLLQTKFPIDFAGVHDFGTTVIGPANCAMSVRMAARSS